MSDIDQLDQENINAEVKDAQQNQDQEVVPKIKNEAEQNDNQVEEIDLDVDDNNNKKENEQEQQQQEQEQEKSVQQQQQQQAEESEINFDEKSGEGNLDDLLQSQDPEQFPPLSKSTQSRKIMSFIKQAPGKIKEKNSSSFQNFKKQQTIKLEEQKKKKQQSDIMEVQEIAENQNEEKEEEEKEKENQQQQQQQEKEQENELNEYTFKINRDQQYEEQQQKIKESNEKVEEFQGFGVNEEEENNNKFYSQNEDNNKTSNFGGGAAGDNNNNPFSLENNNTEQQQKKNNFKKIVSNQHQATKKLMLNSIQEGDLDSIKAIIQNFQFDINEELGSVGQNQTMLHFAVFFKQQEIVEFLIHLAYRKYSLNYFDILNIQTDQGNTPLMLATDVKNTDAYDILMVYGGQNLALKNNQNENVLEIAKRNELKEISEELEAAMKDIEITITNVIELEKNSPTLEKLLEYNSSPEKIAQLQEEIKKTQIKKVEEENNNKLKDQKSQSVSYIGKQQQQKNLMSPSTTKGSLRSGRMNSPNQYQQQVSKDKLLQKKKQLEEKMRNIDMEIQHLQDDIPQNKKSEFSYKKRQIISQDQQAQKNALDLVQRMNLQKKQKELKKQEENLVARQRMLQEAENSQLKKVEIKQRLMDDKKQQIAEKLEQQRRLRQDQHDFNMKSNQIIKELKMNRKINDKHKAEVDMPELEKRKQKLAEKRQIYRPIDHQEIRNHAKKHDEDLKVKLQENQKQRMLQGKEFPNERISNYIPIKTNFTRKILEQEKVLKEKDLKELEHKKQLKERQRKYGELVKDLYTPQFDNVSQMPPEETGMKKKLNWMQQQPEKQKPKMFRYYLPKKQSKSNDVLSHKSQPDHQESQPTLSKYQEYNQKTKKFLESNFQNPGGNSTSNVMNTQNNNNNEDGYNTMDSKYMKSPQRQTQNPKNIDYIKDLRRMREQNEGHYKQENWDKYIKNDKMELTDKYSHVLQSAQRIENLAKMKEQSQGQEDPQNMEQINHLYIDSIKAKLALLDQLKTQKDQ